MNREQIEKVQAALDFLCRRLEENGLYSPALQPVVSEALNILLSLRNQPQGEPVAWVIPGDDTANANGFIDAMCYRDGEFTRPLYAATPADGVVVPKIVIQALRDRIAMAYGDLPKDCPPGPPTGILATLDALLAAPKGGE